jgi:hypothetical protein
LGGGGKRDEGGKEERWRLEDRSMRKEEAKGQGRELRRGKEGEGRQKEGERRERK